MLFPTVLALVSPSLASFTFNTIPRHGVEPPSGKYVVKLKGDVTSLAATDLKASLTVKPRHDYSMSTFRGFASTLTAAEKASLEASDLVRNQSSALS